MVLQPDQPSGSSHTSSLTCRSCCTAFERSPSPRTSSSNNALTTTLNNIPSSQCTPCKKPYGSFEPLPLVPKISSFQLSFIFNTGESFLSPQPIHHGQSCNSISYQASHGHYESIRESYHIPEDYNHNDPYTPWPHHLRPLIISPPTSMSRVSQYSRPYSRSGARAPEPAQSRTSVYGMGCCIPRSYRWRRIKRHVQLFSRRLRIFKAVLRNRNARRSSISSSHIRASSIVFSMHPRRSSIVRACSRMSATSLARDSLASWVDARNLASMEYAISPSSGHVSMDIDEYERRGSWLTDPDRGCEIDSCSIHRSQDKDRIETYNWKYFGVSLAAGQEATRRRRKLDHMDYSTSELVS